MALVSSLLTAIVRANGDALVMHVGEKPYVVTSTGPIDLSSQGLNLEAMSGMLGQLLPADALRALSEFGAVEHELLPRQAMQGDRFTVVAARGGDDVWIEIRRHRMQRPSEPSPQPAPAVAPERVGPPAPVAAAVAPVGTVPPIDPSAPVAAPVAPVVSAAAPAAAVATLTSSPETGQEAVAEPDSGRKEQPTRAPHRPTEPGSSVVVPMTRTLRIEVPSRVTQVRPGGVERLLGLAAARGASALYLTSQSRPFLRIDGDIRALDSEAPLASADVEAAVLELMPESAREALRRGEPTEWVSELADIGRVRCTTFRDYRGPGALFHLISVRPVSAEQLGLSREIQALATEGDGLILVAGPRGAGKSTLVAAFVDLINRQHSSYVVTLERQIRVVHENRQSLISQREVRGTAEETLATARAALRENPDVLVIEDLRSPDIFQLALDAAGSGLLVFVSVTAGSTSSAISRALDLFPPDRRTAAQAVLAERLRGVVAQVLLRKSGGGRIAARELLLTTTAVASLLAEGQISQLAVAMDSGRKYGMVPLNDTLLAFVQSGAIDVREAYRKADDRDALLTLFKREGVDTSFVVRLA